MGVYQLQEEQQINVTRDEVWDFISSPSNLKIITPDYMGFEVTSDGDLSTMYPGMIISYKVSPLFGINMNWVTEITHVKERTFFVDEQRVGPYKMWHHQHILEENDNGVLMKDIVTYVPPFGILGSMANSIFIKRQLAGIFTYRRKIIEDLFNTHKVNAFAW